MKRWMTYTLIAAAAVLQACRQQSRRSEPEAPARHEEPDSSPPMRPRTTVPAAIATSGPAAPQVAQRPRVVLYNPPPLLIGWQGTPVPPGAEIWLVVERPARQRPSIGAYEHRPAPIRRPPCDVTLNGQVTQYDVYMFGACATGPAVPFPTTIRMTRDGQARSIDCSLADFDGDGDVDQSDFGQLQAALTESYVWGDVDRDGDVDPDDVACVTTCSGQACGENDACHAADLNETGTVNSFDAELAQQALREHLDIRPIGRPR